MAIAAGVYACNVPVFRFALERWRPDAYRVTLLHRGPLNEAQRELIQPLNEVQDKQLANLALRTVDLSELEASQSGTKERTPLPREEILSHLKAGEAWLVVQYPEHLRIEIPVWEGRLERQSIARLTDSPVRKELVRRLAEGQTAVWLLLESGNGEKDTAAAELLEEELRGLQQSLKLPELTSDPDDELLASTPFKVAFSVLRVSRKATEEEALAGMLVRCEEDLAERADPIAFPVFGRGRALLPLVGAGITAKNIQDASGFLVGPCSCQVKNQNPGFDLLLSADWETLLSQSGQPRRAIQTVGLLSGTYGNTELVPIPSGSREEATEVAAAAGSELQQVASGANHHTWMVSGGVLVGIAAFVVLVAAMHAGKS